MKDVYKASDSLRQYLRPHAWCVAVEANLNDDEVYILIQVDSAVGATRSGVELVYTTLLAINNVWEGFPVSWFTNYQGFHYQPI